MALARAGKAMRSPALGALPLGSRMARAAGSARSRSTLRRQSAATFDATGKPLAASVDRGLQQPVDAELAVIVGEAAPRLDRARHRHRMHAVGRDLADAAIQEPLGAGGGGRAAGAVIGDDLVAALGRDQHEAIAADAGHRRLDDAERGGGGDRGVDRVAAGAQDVDGDQGGEGMGGCGRAALRDHRGTPRLIKVAIWMEQGRTPCLG